MTDEFFSQLHKHAQNGKIQIVPTGVKPMNFQLQVQMLNQGATGDYWELRH